MSDTVKSCETCGRPDRSGCGHYTAEDCGFASLYLWEPKNRPATMSEELEAIRALVEQVGKTTDETISYKVWDDALEALSRLEAREAEAPKDARECAERVYNAMKVIPSGGAAEIERYVQSRIAAAFDSVIAASEPKPKTVPMAMLEELAAIILSQGKVLKRDEYARLALIHGYEAIE